MSKATVTLPAWLEALEEEDMGFLRRFLLCSGSLKAMAEEYGVSYPTVRGRLDRLIAKVRVAEDAKPADPFERRLRSSWPTPRSPPRSPGNSSTPTANRSKGGPSNETPWFDPNAWAWLPGTLFGCLGGLWGARARACSPRRGRPGDSSSGWLRCCRDVRGLPGRGGRRLLRRVSLTGSGSAWACPASSG